jgi:prepilin-type N-terminal cleavage/methylation domain-containing protein
LKLQGYTIRNQLCMKKGFTLIEVIIALMVFCIFFTCIIGLDSAIFNTLRKSKDRDNEYNIARAICEKFESEKGVVVYKKVVLYLDGVDDMNQSISDSLKFSIEPSKYSYIELKTNNFEHKKYAAIINCFENEFLNFVEVNSFSMKHISSGVKLRIARCKSEI